MSKLTIAEKLRKSEPIAREDIKDMLDRVMYHHTYEIFPGSRDTNMDVMMCFVPADGWYALKLYRGYNSKSPSSENIARFVLAVRAVLPPALDSDGWTGLPSEAYKFPASPEFAKLEQMLTAECVMHWGAQSKDCDGMMQICDTEGVYIGIAVDETSKADGETGRLVITGGAMMSDEERKQNQDMVYHLSAEDVMVRVRRALKKRTIVSD